MSAVLSAVTVSAVGLTCKAFLNSGLCSVEVNGLHTLRNALESPKRSAGQGIITICNHISTLDDPVVWGVLPVHYYLRSRTTRWALGASDIMFTNPIFSTFFSLGQTLETFRGQGIHQAAVNTAIQKVNEGGWVHLYGEGKVNQPMTYPLDKHGQAHLPRFKWGVGRILMEAKTPPMVIPMWLTGFDKLMPEGRPFPYKYLPRIGARLSVTFGDPVSEDEIAEALNITRTPRQQHGADVAVDAHYTALVRKKVTAILHRDVEALGKSISGKLLNGIP
ncbi:hypothetical protein BDN70DRAFT_854183 [Pholiota conissans]|uniref:Tafazzin family protein n=1 Tax=Pholiota conissans TaxID=109636 RepID=A0A9P6D318_9AGAR|nr:hypothetical protein BDN70DRAFT_854183 [Pholiota conissans]